MYKLSTLGMYFIDTITLTILAIGSRSVREYYDYVQKLVLATIDNIGLVVFLYCIIYVVIT